MNLAIYVSLEYNVVAQQMGLSLMWSVYIHYRKESGHHL